MEQKKKEAEFNAIVGEKKDIAWGSQIRSYVFQPYQLVKDHRTGHQVVSVSSVMDGDLDGFIEAFLKKKLGKGSDQLSPVGDEGDDYLARSIWSSGLSSTIEQIDQRDQKDRTDE